MSKARYYGESTGELVDRNMAQVRKGIGGKQSSVTMAIKRSS